MVTVTPAEDKSVSSENSEFIDATGNEQTFVLFDGTLPAPTGNVPKFCHTSSLDDQQHEAGELYAFLSAEDSQPLELGRNGYSCAHQHP